MASNKTSISLSIFLERYKNQEIFYKPNPGNGGDALIALGAFKLLNESGLNYSIIENENQYDLTDKVIIYAGGGNLVDEYNHCKMFINSIKEKAKEIIILPHTVKGKKKFLQNLDERVTIFCREIPSYEYLKNLDLKINIFIDHDLAFRINPKDYIKNSYSSLSAILYLKTFLKKMLIFEKREGYKVLRAYRLDIEKTNIKIPYDNLDVSNAINYQKLMSSKAMVNQTVSDIFKFLNYFDIIETNRLHIAIAGALLEKKVFMSNNSYYKNKAVYNYSIENKFNNVVFVDD